MRLEDAKSKPSLLLLLYLDVLVVSIILLESSDSLSVFKTEPELAVVGAPVLVDLPAVALWQAVDKPSLIDVGITRIFAVLVLKNSSETVEVLGVNQNLSLVNIVVVLSDADQLKLKPIWLMDLRRSVRVFHVVIGIDASMALNPIFLSDEELSGSGP